jgi:hypothetical protein
MQCSVWWLPDVRSWEEKELERHGCPTRAYTAECYHIQKIYIHKKTNSPWVDLVQARYVELKKEVYMREVRP